MNGHHFRAQIKPISPPVAVGAFMCKCKVEVSVIITPRYLRFISLYAILLFVYIKHFVDGLGHLPYKSEEC